MSLNQFAVALVVPPLILVPIALGGAIVGWRFRRTGLTIATIATFFLLLLAMPAVGGSLLSSLERGLPLTPPAGDPPQAIVILAGDAGHRAGPLIEAIGPLTLERLVAGARLYRRVHLPILVTGGRTEPRPDPSLAARMAHILRRDFGVPVRWEEQRSKNTCQNAAFSARILRQNGIHSIYVVTHAWHMRRALFCFRHYGMVVTAAPVTPNRAPTPILSDFAPSMHGWLDSYYGFHEWIGLLWYHLRY